MKSQEMEKDNMRDHMRPMPNQADDKYTNPNSGKIRNATIPSLFRGGRVSALGAHERAVYLAFDFAHRDLVRFGDFGILDFRFCLQLVHVLEVDLEDTLCRCCVGAFHALEFRRVFLIV